MQSDRKTTDRKPAGKGRGDDDDEFGYADEFDNDGNGGRPQSRSAGRGGPGAATRAPAAAVKGSMNVADDDSYDDDADHVGSAGQGAAYAGGAGAGTSSGPSGMPPSGGGSNPGPGVLGIPPPKHAFNAAAFAAQVAGLKGVTDDIREILGYIAAFSPSPVELPTPLKPFIPDYIPAVSEVDPFIKPDRPDGQREELGWTRLDEPSPVQSDPTVLDLRLRALSKKAGLQPVAVRALEQADKNPKEISKWIASIAELHRSRPPPSVHYTRPMPDIDTLMQEWPTSFENQLRDLPLPTAELDLTTEEYARLVCALTDIPVYPSSAGAAAAAAQAASTEGEGSSGAGPGGNQLVQALHVLFTLYHEFRSNPHFAALQGGGAVGKGGPNSPGSPSSGRGSGSGFTAPLTGGMPQAERLEIRRGDEQDSKMGY